MKTSSQSQPVLSSNGHPDAEAAAAKEWPRWVEFNAWTLVVTLQTGRQVRVGRSEDGAHWVFTFGEPADPDGHIHFALSAEAFEAVELCAATLRWSAGAWPETPPVADAAEEPSPRQVHPAIREDQ